MKKWIILSIITVALATTTTIVLNLRTDAEEITNSYDLKASELLSLYEADEMKADQLYLNKQLTVEGTVQRIRYSKDRIISLAIGDGNNQASLLTTFFSKDRPKVGAVKAGDEIKVTGLCGGFLMDVLLTNCQIIDLK